VAHPPDQLAEALSPNSAWSLPKRLGLVQLDAHALRRLHDAGEVPGWLARLGHRSMASLGGSLDPALRVDSAWPPA